MVLLHGGLAPGETMGQQARPLSERFRVYVPDRRGHGRTQDVGPITFDLMAADTVAFLRDVVGGPAHLVGWSDGGIVGLVVALQAPELVRSLVTIGTNFHYDGGVMSAADFGLTADAPEMKGFRDLYAKGSPDGPDHWPVVFEKVTHLWTVEPALTVEDLARIQAPVLVMAGDDDMVRLDHSVEMYQAIPRGQLAIVPGASHALPMEKPELVNRFIVDFVTGGEPRTQLPIRRAGR